LADNPNETDIYVLPGESRADSIAEERVKQLEWLFSEKTMEPLASPSSDISTLPTGKRMAPPIPASVSVDTILCGDSLERIRELPSESVQLVITSPPYFNQRDYGGEGIGNEASLTEYLDSLLQLFGECLRVIGDEGSIVFNLGDKYADSSLLLVPYRFAIAVTATFPVRLVNNITWVKQNPTPRQFRRRLVSSTEPFFHFVKSDNYYYNIDAFLHDTEAEIRKKSQTAGRNLGKRYFELIESSELSPEEKSHARRALTEVIREVQIGKIAGFRMKIRGIHAEAFGGQEGGRKIQMEKNGFTIIRLQGQRMKRDVIETPVETLKNCPHPAIYPVEIVQEFVKMLTVEGDLVLDPFMGSGSTAVACKQLGRHYIGFDINPEYCEYAQKRVTSL